MHTHKVNKWFEVGQAASNDGAELVPRVEVSEQGNLRDKDEIWSEGWRKNASRSDRGGGCECDTAMQQNIVRSNEWRGARGFRGRKTKGRRHSTAQYKDLKKRLTGAEQPERKESQ